MALSDLRTRMICHKCKTNLVRIPQSFFRIAETEPNTSIICPECGAFGGYEQVAKNGDGLSLGPLLPDERANLRKKLGIV